ncbi:MAG TPA: hypothetical protein PKA66_01695 [Gemmatimonadales bacterium]|nr:hypothetical protein [Gemmatimonadales bacterium]
MSARLTTPKVARFMAPLLMIGFMVLALAPARGSSAVPTEPALSPDLDSVRAALDKYKDPVQAVHDGFLSTLACMDFPKGAAEGTMQYAPGAMGIHFLNMGNVGPTLDPMKPQVLMYEPGKDGKLVLIAAEWFMPVQLVTGDTPPSIFGHQLQGPMEGHPPIMPASLHHYDLHVWLWKNNPAGTFSPTNPDVKCGNYAYSFAEDATKMVHDHTH